MNGKIAMSDNNPYLIIKEFCSKSEHKNNKLVEKILVHTFYKEYDELIKDEKSKRQNLSDEEINGFRNSLLSEINLRKNEEIALAEIGASVKNEIKLIKGWYKIKNSLSVILLNVISSIIFTLLLILLFFLAESQIKPIVKDLLAPAITVAPTEPATPDESSQNDG